MAPEPAKARILLVEDDKDVLGLLALKLEGEGYRCLKAMTAEQGLKLARGHRPDLIILDVVLPRMDGTELIQILRRETQVPILFLTAKSGELDRVLGFKLGADDYITKPFSFDEVAARVKAILKRLSPPARPWKGPIIVGRLEVDAEKREARVGGRYVPLTPREFDVLRRLAEAEGRRIVTVKNIGYKLQAGA